MNTVQCTFLMFLVLLFGCNLSNEEKKSRDEAALQYSKYLKGILITCNHPTESHYESKCLIETSDYNFLVGCSNNQCFIRDTWNKCKDGRRN